MKSYKKKKYKKQLFQNGSALKASVSSTVSKLSYFYFYIFEMDEKLQGNKI